MYYIQIKQEIQAFIMGDPERLHVLISQKSFNRSQTVSTIKSNIYLLGLFNWLTPDTNFKICCKEVSFGGLSF